MASGEDDLRALGLDPDMLRDVSKQVSAPSAGMPAVEDPFQDLDNYLSMNEEDVEAAQSLFEQRAGTEFNWTLAQSSPEWHELRERHAGGTEAHKFLVLPAKKEKACGAVLGKAACTLADKIASAVVGMARARHLYNGDDVISEAMQFGRANEEHARNWYSAKYEREVYEVGYLTNDQYPYIGFSPDGFVPTEDPKRFSLLEIKCPNEAGFMRMVNGLGDNSVIDPKYMAQMQLGMFLSGAQEAHLVTFSPFSHNGNPVHIVEPDQDTFDRFEEAFAAFKERIEKTLWNYQRLAGSG